MLFALVIWECTIGTTFNRQVFPKPDITSPEYCMHNSFVMYDWRTIGQEVHPGRIERHRRRCVGGACAEVLFPDLALSGDAQTGEQDVLVLRQERVPH